MLLELPRQARRGRSADRRRRCKGVWVLSPQALKSRCGQRLQISPRGCRNRAAGRTLKAIMPQPCSACLGHLLSGNQGNLRGPIDDLESADALPDDWWASCPHDSRRSASNSRLWSPFRLASMRSQPPRPASAGAPRLLDGGPPRRPASVLRLTAGRIPGCAPAPARPLTAHRLGTTDCPRRSTSLSIYLTDMHST